MRRILRKLIPNSAINYGKHLPTAVLANLKYGFPSRKIVVVGVTGTDGKTTTVNMLYQILKNAGKKVSMISTINAVVGDKTYDTGFHITNPTHFDLQGYIAQATKAGSEILVLETTSQGLVQFRTWGVKFDIGVITNITHEHLDYHKTWENYFNAKAKLIKDVRVAVLNKDEKHFERLSKLTKGKIVSFGLHKNANFNPSKFPLKIKLPGEYNLLNAEAAAAVAVNLGIDAKTIKETLNNFSSLEGRMEEIPNNLGIKIIVDFAHTPNALEQALKTLRKGTKGKLIAVFGAASERDIKKRPLMGAISAQYADLTVLTDEDPRFEDSLKIIEEIAKGAIESGAKEGETLYKEPDRTKAIKLALELAKKGDLVGIFGKGHERSINYQGVEKPWSDKKAVEDATN
jgi:UDP-N-acetylmuramoyl-L-alanyl-D-glutamate--2,6-diaminopimelate ligase